VKWIGNQSKLTHFFSTVLLQYLLIFVLQDSAAYLLHVLSMPYTRLTDLDFRAGSCRPRQWQRHSTMWSDSIHWEGSPWSLWPILTPPFHDVKTGRLFIIIGINVFASVFSNMSLLCLRKSATILSSFFIVANIRDQQGNAPLVFFVFA